MGGDIPGWRRNIPRMAARYRVVAYDFRGNGRSDKPDEPMTMDTFAQDTVALLDHLGLVSSHLYGQSFGGMVGLELALTHSARVRSLVLAATHAGSRRASRPGPGAHVPKDKPYLALYSPGFAETHPDHVEEDILVGSQNPQPPYAGRRQWEAMQEWDAWDRLAEVSCPVLVLHGTEDRLVSVENARRLAATIPGGRLVLLEGAGHVYHSEQDEASDSAVLAFLDQVESRA
jgi:pimeloyl-ACP methyl ester carboxylesterase